MTTFVLHERVGSVLVVTFQGLLRDPANEATILQEFADLNLPDEQAVLIDCSQIVILSSATIGVVLSLRAQLKRKLAFCSMKTTLMEQLTTLNALSLLFVFPDKERGLSYFR